MRAIDRAALVAIAALFATGCGDRTAFVLTIEARSTVREFDRIRVEVEDEDGDSKAGEYEVADGVGDGKTLTIATEGRSGELLIRVEGIESAHPNLAIASGETRVEVDGEAALVVLEPSEFGVNERIVGFQSLTSPAYMGSQLAVGAEGRFVVVWESSGSPSSLIMGRLFDAEARPLENGAGLTSGDFQVPFEPNNDAHPAIAYSGDRYLVAWQRRTESWREELFYNTYAGADAEPLTWLDNPLPTSAAHSDNAPAVFARAEGGFGVTWVRFGEGAYDGGQARLQLIDSGGELIGSDLAVSAGGGETQDNVVATRLSGGGFVVVWQDSRNGGFEERIYARGFSAEGVAVTGDVMLSGDSDYERWIAPRAVAVNGGGFGVTWVHDRSAGAVVELQFFDNHVQAEIAEPIVVAELVGWGASAIATRDDGAVAVSWYDGNSSGQENDVYCRLFSAAFPAGVTREVNTTLPGNQLGPSIAGFGSDAFLVAWSDDYSGPPDTDGGGVSARVVYDPPPGR